MDDAALYRLMSWLSPSFPVGAYCYSHGLETAVDAGLVTDADSLEDWLATVLRHGGGRLDAGLFHAAYGRARANDWAGVDAVVAHAAAQRSAAELALETTAQGAAFLDAARAAWPHPWLARLALGHGHGIAHPVAVAVAAAAFDIPRRAAASAYLHAFAANLVSAGVRLIPLGQSDGQRVIAALMPVVGECAAAEVPLDEIATAAPVADWCAMAHETQHVRLFRS
jgi:urease accessory protein